MLLLRHNFLDPDTFPNKDQTDDSLSDVCKLANKENGDNDYANGVHDGYLDVFMKLGIDTNEEYYN